MRFTQISVNEQAMEPKLDTGLSGLPVAFSRLELSHHHGAGKCSVCDPATLASMLLRWDIVVRARGARFQMDKEFSITPGVALFVDRYAHGVRTHGICPRDAVTLLIPLNERDGLYLGREMRADTCFASIGGAIDLSAGEGQDILVIRVALPLLSQTEICPDLRTRLEAAQVLEIPLESARVRRAVAHLRAPLHKSALGAPLSGEQAQHFEIDVTALVATILGGVANPRYECPRRRAKTFTRALEAIMSLEDCAAMSADELAQVVGVSPRTLLYAFREHVGASPGQFMRERRLQEMRCRLLFDPKCHSVSKAAALSGFSELGRLAGQYRRYFGELPSHTLRRRQQTVGELRNTLRS